jgi:CMP-N-acetylneuraminic acid synthetase
LQLDKYSKLNYQVIIPARGGSKRFPQKNIHLLNGVPLIAHSILFALKSFDKTNIWVNTDDDEIALVADNYGVNITMRPKELGSDTASTADVLFFQSTFFYNNNIPCDAMILLQATNPIRPQNLIQFSISEFEKNNRNSLASFSSLNRKFGKINNSFYTPTNYKPGQRMQDIEPDYFENGLIYITKIDSIQQKEIITLDVFPLLIDDEESLVDIDELKDMLFAEFLLINTTIYNG